MIPEPMARFSAALLSAVLALLSAGWGKNKIQLFGVFLLIVSIWAAFDAYPEAVSGHGRYVEHARQIK